MSGRGRWWLGVAFLVWALAGCAEGSTEDDPASPTLQIVDGDALQWQVQTGDDAQAIFGIRNSGERPLEFDLVHSADWLELEPLSGEVSPGGERDIVASVSCGSEPSNHEATVQLQHNDPSLAAVGLGATLECSHEVEAEQGEVEIIIEGLPETVAADVVVSADEGYSATVTESVVLDDVPVGSATVSASGVQGDAVYTPVPAQSTVDVVAGQRAEVAIEYGAVTGGLQIEVQGLPAGLDAELVVARDGDQWSVPSDGLVEDLAPGTYTVVSDDVQDGETLYRASDIDAVVESDAIANVVVEYIADPGSLQVDVEGLPAGVNHDIDVIDQAGQTTALPQSGVLSALAPGNYEIEPRDVDDGVTSYRGEGASVEVFSEETASATVVYEAVPGTLAIEVSGLPTGASPSIAVDGPGGAQSYDEALVIEEAPPGNYEVVFENITHQGVTYTVVDSPFSVDVESGQSTTVEGSYETTPGLLEFSVQEYGDVEFSIAVSGPGGFDETITEAKTFNDVQAGTYTLSIEELPVDANGNEGYVNLEPSGSVDIASGDAVTVNIVVGAATVVATEESDGPGALTTILDGSLAPGSVVTFHESVQTVALSEGEIAIDTTVELVGDDQASVTIEGGNHRIFRVQDGGFFSVQGVTFRQGESEESGGAIHIESGGAVIAERAIFEDNLALDRGGAIFVANGAELLVSESIFRGNIAADNGGAIGTESSISSDAIIDIESSLFESNSTDEDGGALFLSNESTVYESTFVDNSAVNRGGAIRIWANDVVIQGCTVTDNEADEGGGINHFGDSSTTMMLGRSIVAGNQAAQSPDVGRTIDTQDPISDGYNVIGVEGGGFEAGQEGDEVGSDTSPILAELDGLSDNGGFSETRMPSAQSPARALIPAADCEAIHRASLPVRDQRLKPRPAGAFCNAGAVELDASFETFDDADMSASSYEAGSFVGNNGVEWSYEQTRRSTSNYSIDGTSVILHYDQPGWIQSESISGGIESLSMQLAQAFTGSGDRQVEVFINGNSVGTSDPFFDSDPPNEVQRFAIDGIDISGSFDIEVRSIGDGQVLVDNISWR